MRYYKERGTALLVSGILHAVLFLLIIIGLPDFFSRKPPPEPLVLTVDILPISELSNVKSAEAPPQPKQQEKEKTPKAVKQTSPTTAAPPPPPPPPPQPNPAPPKPQPKEPKPTPKPPEKSKADPLDNILKDIAQKAQKEKGKPTKEVEKASPSRAHSDIPYNPNIPLSLSLRDSIRQQIYKCWSVDAGAKDAYKLIVVVDLWLNRDGTLVEAQYTKDTLRKMADPNYRSAAERAYRAVKLCSPLTGLPADKYEGWSYMEFTFDPSQMLY